MIIVNGKVTNEEIVNLDSGFYFGRGLFETILVKDEPILLSEHLERLNQGLKKLHISQNITEEYVLENIKKFSSSKVHSNLKLENIKNDKYALKLIVTEKNILFLRREVTYKKEDYERGFNIIISNLKRNSFSMVTYLKSLNYTDNMVERENALEAGFNEVLFLNTENIIAEASTSNIFFVKNNKLHTPKVECGILDGIIRKQIIDNNEVLVGDYTLEELFQSEAVFLTNSLLGIMPVASINHKNNHGKIYRYNLSLFESFKIKGVDD